MPDKQYQYQLLESESFDLGVPDADIGYDPNFLEHHSANALFEHILSTTEWRQETITIYGKQHRVPRLSCWMADVGLDYAYSNMTMKPVAWSTELLALKNKLKQYTNQAFNSVLINYYRDGQDSNGWHADNEPELGVDPIIASLSLGAPRDFQLRHNHNKQLKYSIALQHGSLLLMQGTTQRYWQHHVPKRANAQQRINLTFRTIKTPH